MEVLERVESLEETVAWFVRESRAERIEDNKKWEKKMEAEKQQRIENDKKWEKKMEAIEKQTEAIKKQTEEIKKQTEAIEKKTEESAREWEEEKRLWKEERRERNKQWGETANRLGTLVEDIVAPNIEGLAFNYFGCKSIESFTPRIKRPGRGDKSKLREFDCILICEDFIIVSDTKTTPTPDKVDQFIEVLKEIFDYFPEAEGRRVIPIFSSLYLPKSLVTYLTRNNIYALAMGSETMELLNREELITHYKPNIQD
ncbi:hypothetical protein MBAV_000708 [Candidatus Magnetobacterium bavaricum]|uniref:Uncharacterized protein n=1 Tax=Candidatus Magnetobacterium bavaricum TaxID=29290 RepID=A0A0F3GYQ1_9BACT|nr:hypothetical protein MBAV_000708 [Candidatus Magnetobacterium bavaricum]